MTLTPVRSINLNKFTRRPDSDWVNVSKLVSQDACGTVVVAPTDTGKTNELISMLIQPECMYFDQIWVFAMDIEESKYELLENIAKERNLSMEFSDDGTPPDFILTDDLSLLPAITSIDKDKQTVVIFDDLVMESKKDQKPIVDFYKGGRKRNCQMYYLAQGFFEVPKMIRRNALYFWIYRLRDPREVTGLSGSFELHMSINAFKKMYMVATRMEPRKEGEKKGKCGFLFINTKMDYVPYRYRHGFNKVLSSVPMN